MTSPFRLSATWGVFPALSECKCLYEIINKRISKRLEEKYITGLNV